MVLDSREAVLRNLADIRSRIQRASDRAGRDPSGVRLVAAAKTIPSRAIRWVNQAGVSDLGENYVKELVEKRSAAPDATWHFLGALQSHTAHKVAEHADVVHTLSPGSAVARLGRRAAERGRSIPALIEVDFTGVRTGAAVEVVGNFADEVAGTAGLELVGLMTLPPLPETSERSRPYFRRLKEMGDQLSARYERAVELSMGMSMDYEVAVEEGATMVRIGTALFGERAPRA